jgi:hypothetical protein
MSLKRPAVAAKVEARDPVDAGDLLPWLEAGSGILLPPLGAAEDEDEATPEPWSGWAHVLECPMSRIWAITKPSLSKYPAAPWCVIGPRLTEVHAFFSSRDDPPGVITTSMVNRFWRYDPQRVGIRSAS